MERHLVDPSCEIQQFVNEGATNDRRLIICLKVCEICVISLLMQDGMDALAAIPG